MKRLKIASNKDTVAAWKQAAQWMINKGHSIPSIQALSQKEPGILDDDWGDLVHEAEATTFDFCGHPHRLVESYDDIHLEPVLPNQLYIVQMADPPYTVLKGLPTPMMIAQGEGEGWNEDGIWRFRDDKYDPQGTQYTRIRVFRNPNR